MEALGFIPHLVEQTVVQCVIGTVLPGYSDQQWLSKQLGGVVHVVAP